jgi:metal-dependent amidase/aminoacylase/carboxypeptidase family protein
VAARSTGKAGDVHRTAAFVAEKLNDLGCDETVTASAKPGGQRHPGKGNSSDRVIGLRADMDALPIQETTGPPHASSRVQSAPSIHRPGGPHQVRLPASVVGSAPAAVHDLTHDE